MAGYEYYFNSIPHAVYGNKLMFILKRVCVCHFQDSSTIGNPAPDNSGTIVASSTIGLLV